MKILGLPLIVAVCSCASAPGPVVPETPVERQMIGLLEKFDRWDHDGDGKLTAAELVEAERLTGQPPSKIVDFYDSNKDGAISLREAQTGYSRVDEAEIKAKE